MSFLRSLRKQTFGIYSSYNKWNSINHIFYNYINKNKSNKDNNEYYQSIKFQKDIDTFRKSIEPGEENIYLCLFNDISSKTLYNDQVITNNFLCDMWGGTYNYFGSNRCTPFDIGNIFDKKEYQPIIHEINCEQLHSYLICQSDLSLSKYLYLLPIYKNKEWKNDTYLEFITFWLKVRERCYKAHYSKMKFYNKELGNYIYNEKLSQKEFNNTHGLVIKDLIYITKSL